MANRSAFWQRHPGLVWSNPDADDSAFICAALLHPRYTRLLDIAAEFGLERLQREWQLLRRENTPEARRAAVFVERILGHIEKGFALAGGLDLHDYQQNFVVNGDVKVSFFAPEAPLRKLLAPASEPNPRVATLAELFKTKCLVSAARSKIRDWLDLYLLLRDHGFTMADYVAAFREAGVEDESDIGLARLCSGQPQHGDEGYVHLLPKAPSLEEMKTFFIAERDRLEVELARVRKQQNR